MKKFIIILFCIVTVLLSGNDSNAQAEIVSTLSEQMNTIMPVKIEQIKQELDARFRQREYEKPDIYIESTLYNNYSEIYQTGNNNIADVNQYGYDNRIRLTQSGEYNSYTADQRGADIELITEQAGNGNSIIQMLSGSGYTYNFIQQGINNEIIQVESGHSIPEYHVTQKGNNMKILIINGAAAW